MQTCTDIWILHNLDNDDRTEGRCVLWQDFYTIQARSLKGPFDIGIHNQDFPLTESPENTHSVEFYSFVMDINQVNDFPKDLRDNHTSVTVARLQSAHISVSHLTGMGFSTNHSIMQQHGHVVHIRMMQNRMCVPDLNNLDKLRSDVTVTSDIKTLYLIGYHYLHRGLLGQKTSVCTATIKHNHCERKRQVYKLLTVEFAPGTNGYTRGLIYQISIKQIKEGNCSLQCSLSVDIWKKIMKDGAVHHLRWSKITFLQWDLVGPSIRNGFKLMIGMACKTPCINACPFSFGFQSSSQSVAAFQIRDFDILDGDGLLNGSWKQADAYCARRGGHLPMITSRNSG